ncbi:MAG: hypothetical protein ACI9W6_000388 [Motiliproteus sp.]
MLFIFIIEQSKDPSLKASEKGKILKFLLREKVREKVDALYRHHSLAAERVLQAVSDNNIYQMKLNTAKNDTQTA